MRDRIRHFFLVTACILILGCFAFVATDILYASNGTVSFGSESYEVESGNTFNVGVYVSSDSVITNYHVELHYDSSKVKYIDGADIVDETNGIMYFDGESNADNFRFWLTLQAVNGGTSNFVIRNTFLNAVSEDGEVVEVEMASLGSAPITVVGSEEPVIEEPVEEEPVVEIPVEEVPATDEIITELKEPVAFNEQSLAEILADISDGTEVEAPAEIVEEPVQEEVTVTETVEPVNEPLEILGFSGIELYIVGAVAAIGIIFALIGLILLLVDMRREKKERIETIRRKQELERRQTIIEDLDKSESECVTENVPEQLPVIKVEDVSMKFNIATSNTSGIKDYIIQKIKKQVTTKEFYALKNISFDVFKGEVVGVIGTNGSGKSTILKIISGAMDPTGGRVLVDRRKIQILTLGTGFDMELTAKENVYLNGSIIGYTKEFIDEHYQEIVEFAELEDFMEEKVKNFSSGMVSRLGFAIATVADAAEILILDEVLAVGDEFFRKKSLARVKEMIHGGSTVLLVSHSMQTIVENCTKCVWIEKGELKMVGDPKEVSKAYANQNA